MIAKYQTSSRKNSGMPSVSGKASGKSIKVGYDCKISNVFGKASAKSIKIGCDCKISNVFKKKQRNAFR